MINLYKTILPGQTIGIIGGGQLGRFMAIAAKNMGYNVAVLDPTPNCPCGQVSDIEVTAAYDDLDAIKKLAEMSDVITYEFENIDYEALTWLEQHAYLPQGSQLLSITQDRQTEKEAIVDAGATVAPFRVVEQAQQLAKAVEEIGLPAVLKTCRGGYDGKGQFVIRHKEEAEQAKSLLEKGRCVLEKWISFDMEISVIVTRSVKEETTTFPVAENIHVNNILHQSIVPARIDDTLKEKAIQAAKMLASKLGLIGTLAVEMFVSNGDIYINELAPRPHNSGHYTLDLCTSSQFEQHIRAICGLPLKQPSLLHEGIMVNILGQHLQPVIENDKLLTDGKLYLYGKNEAKANRKMGHITFYSTNVELLTKQLNETTIWNRS
ncbi:5-(carboxyamino)imidazole ribonucleotide synthase [Bacillus sp. FJAT-47783]|uniref:5-(carboxyamino)imidazole ribonucleotide synthase n=1 Tax=Bacillus sp. FJAT-47783 TaxID=2922712 RepID=UPI001FACEBB6